MATRYQVALAHQGCTHAGFVVWEERGNTDPNGRPHPVVVTLPRGFVSVTTEDGSIEVLCTSCAQTVAAATTCTGPDARQEMPTDDGKRQDHDRAAAIPQAAAAPQFAGYRGAPPIHGDAIPHPSGHSVSDVPERVHEEAA